jgi:VanZ family protein
MTTNVFFRWVAWLLVLAIAIFTLSPIGLRPISGAPANLERFAAYTVIGTCFGLGYPKRRLAIILMVLGIVGGLELAQHLVPSRHGRLPDGIVKAAGALLGLAAAMIGGRKKAIP